MTLSENEIGINVIRVAIDIHRELGPGLLESVYEEVLFKELVKEGFTVEKQVLVPIIFRGERYAEGFRADLIVEKKVILELKSVEKLTAAHKKQIQTYLSLTDLRLGYLLNFGEALMKDGIVRAVNRLPEIKNT